MASRKWMCTDFKMIWDGILPEWMRYAVWQLERCPKTQRLHWQMFFELHRGQRMSAIQKMLGNKVHCEVAKKRDEARAYCMKEETREDGPRS